MPADWEVPAEQAKPTAKDPHAKLVAV
jgi:hypothetical protein